MCWDAINSSEKKFAPQGPTSLACLDGPQIQGSSHGAMKTLKFLGSGYEKLMLMDLTKT
jgi:hypothetical protein